MKKIKNIHRVLQVPVGGTNAYQKTALFIIYSLAIVVVAACISQNESHAKKQLITVVNHSLRYRNTFEEPLSKKWVVGDTACVVLKFNNNYFPGTVTDSLQQSSGAHEDVSYMSSEYINDSQRTIPVVVESVDRGTYSVISKQ